jgi:nucleotide-binding universal stress UspA family protein
MTSDRPEAIVNRGAIMETTQGLHRIVVGIDGSSGSAAALRWALAEASLRSAEVHAVYAWTYPYAAGVDVVGYVVGADEYEAMHRTSLDTALREAVPEDAVRSTIKTSVVCESAGAALIKAGEDADMIVVGARGHGGFLGLILGSVSTQVVNHASTTVVVVR